MNVPKATPRELLAVACPTCGASVGAYCEDKPGKALLLPEHHQARFYLAKGLAPSQGLS